MYVTTISYKRTVNLGQYNSETLEMTAMVGATEGVLGSVDKLKEYVHAGLHLAVIEPAPVPASCGEDKLHNDLPI